MIVEIAERKGESYAPNPLGGRPRSLSAVFRLQLGLALVRPDRRARFGALPHSLLLLRTEKASEVTDCRRIDRCIGIGAVFDRIGEPVAAARRQGRQRPIRLDEFQDRDVIGVGVIDYALPGEGRNGDQRNAGAVAKSIEDLDVAAVPIPAALVDGYEDR